MEVPLEARVMGYLPTFPRYPKITKIAHVVLHASSDDKEDNEYEEKDRDLTDPPAMTTLFLSH